MKAIYFTSSRLHGRECNAHELPEFLLQYSLGIIAKMQDEIMIDEEMSSIFQKVQVIRGLKTLIQLIGPAISSISPQVMGVLQLIIDDKALWNAGLDGWQCFVFNIPKDALKDLFLQIAFNLMQIEPRCDSVQSMSLVRIFEYLIVDNSKTLADQFPRLPEIPSKPQWSRVYQSVKSICAGQKQGLGQVRDLIAQLSHDNITVVAQSVTKLRQILIDEQSELQAMLLSDSIEPWIKDMVLQLFDTCHKYNGMKGEITKIAAECLGVLGAVDPARINVEFPSDGIFGAHLDLSTTDNILRFMCSLIEHYFAPTFRATQNPKLQATLAFTIQETLKWCGFSREVVAEATKPTFQSAKAASKSRPHSILLDCWNLFPKHIIITIEPLVASKYHIGPLKKSPLQYPFYSSDRGYNEWIQLWALDLIPKISDKNVRHVFFICENLIAAADLNTTLMLLPHIILNVVISGDSRNIEEMSREFQAVLSQSYVPLEQHRPSLQVFL